MILGLEIWKSYCAYAILATLAIGFIIFCVWLRQHSWGNVKVSADNDMVSTRPPKFSERNPHKMQRFQHHGKTHRVLHKHGCVFLISLNFHNPPADPRANNNKKKHPEEWIPQEKGILAGPTSRFSPHCTTLLCFTHFLKVFFSY